MPICQYTYVIFHGNGFFGSVGLGLALAIARLPVVLAHEAA